MKKRTRKKTETCYFVCDLRGCYYAPHGTRISELLLNNEAVELRREPRNKHDKNAIAVWYRPTTELAARLRLSRGSFRIGYVAREMAEVLKDVELIGANVVRPTIGALTLKIGARVTV